MPKKKATYKSFSTPEARHGLEAFLVELVMQRKAGKRLPPYFWQRAQYKWQFVNELKAVKKFIKNYGVRVVCAVASNYPLNSWGSYGEAEAALQAEVERERLRAAPKDLSESPKNNIRAENNPQWKRPKSIWGILTALE